MVTTLIFLPAYLLYPSKSENSVSWIVKIVFLQNLCSGDIFLLLIALHSTQDKDNTLLLVFISYKQERNDIPSINVLGWFTVYFLNLPVICPKKKKSFVSQNAIILYIRTYIHSERGRTTAHKSEVNVP